MVVLINAYSSVLTSLLTAPRLKPIAITLKDVAESQELRVTVEKNHFFSRLFLVLLMAVHTIINVELDKFIGFNRVTKITAHLVYFYKSVVHLFEFALISNKFY